MQKLCLGMNNSPSPELLNGAYAKKQAMSLGVKFRAANFMITNKALYK